MNVLIKARERWLGQSIPQDYTRVHSDESAPPTPRASIWSRSSSIWSTATFDDPAWTKTPTFQSRRVALLILALLAAFFAGSHLSTIRERYANEKDDLAEVETVVPTARIVVQFNQDNGAGLGSVIHQMHRSQVFAAALGAQIYAVESFSDSSEHLYDAVGILNEHRSTIINNADFGRVCKVSRYMTQEHFYEFTDAACEALRFDRPVHDLSEKVWERASMMDGCGLIINDLGWDFAPHFSMCTWRLTTTWLGNPQPRVVPDKITVGLHIRWGDMASGQVGMDVRHPWRSIAPTTANKVLKGLEECLGPLDLKVYMETHNDTMLAELEHPYVLVDSGKDLTDLRDLTSNDVMIVGGSGYTMIGHQIARGGMTIVPQDDGSPRWWRETGTNVVLTWEDFYDGARNCDFVREQWDVGHKRSRDTALAELAALEVAAAAS